LLHDIVTKVLAIEVGGFCAKNSKWLSVYLRRVELGELFNGTPHLSMYIQNQARISFLSILF
jgi:hypothetical protein